MEYLLRGGRSASCVHTEDLFLFVFQKYTIRLFHVHLISLKYLQFLLCETEWFPNNVPQNNRLQVIFHLSWSFNCNGGTTFSSNKIYWLSSIFLFPTIFKLLCCLSCQCQNDIKLNIWTRQKLAESRGAGHKRPQIIWKTINKAIVQNTINNFNTS